MRIYSHTYDGHDHQSYQVDRKRRRGEKTVTGSAARPPYPATSLASILFKVRMPERSYPRKWTSPTSQDYNATRFDTA